METGEKSIDCVNMNSGTAIYLNSGSHHGGADGEDGGNAAGSECSESAQSSSLGQEMKNATSLVPHPAEVALIIQQLSEIREEISNLREDLESFKVIHVYYITASKCRLLVVHEVFCNCYCRYGV